MKVDTKPKQKFRWFKKVTAKELEALEGKLLVEKLQPIIEEFINKAHETTEQRYFWYLYERQPNGPEGDIIILFLNYELDSKTRSQLNFNFVAKYDI